MVTPDVDFIALDPGEGRVAHPRERGDPGPPPGQGLLRRSALTMLGARVRGQDKVGGYAE